MKGLEKRIGDVVATTAVLDRRLTGWKTRSSFGWEGVAIGFESHSERIENRTVRQENSGDSPRRHEPKISPRAPSVQRHLNHSDPAGLHSSLQLPRSVSGWPYMGSFEMLAYGLRTNKVVRGGHPRKFDAATGGGGVAGVKSPIPKWAWLPIAKGRGCFGT